MIGAFGLEEIGDLAGLHRKGRLDEDRGDAVIRGGEREKLPALVRERAFWLKALTRALEGFASFERSGSADRTALRESDEAPDLSPWTHRIPGEASTR